jgi:hypothetical protein
MFRGRPKIHIAEICDRLCGVVRGFKAAVAVILFVPGDPSE